MVNPDISGQVYKGDSLFSQWQTCIYREIPKYIMSLSAQGKRRPEITLSFCISTSPFFGVAEPIILIRVTSILKISHIEQGTINPCYFLPSQIPCYRFTSNSKQPLPLHVFQIPENLSKFRKTSPCHLNKNLLSSHYFSGTQDSLFSQENLVWEISTYANHFIIISSRIGLTYQVFIIWVLASPLIVSVSPDWKYYALCLCIASWRVKTSSCR